MSEALALNNDMSAGRTFENITQHEISLAQEMGVSLDTDIQDRLNQVVSKTNNALRLAVEAGLGLISIKSECEHGEFGALIEEKGISRQRASEMMAMARAASLLPAAQRSSLLELTKKKALLLAKTDPEIMQAALDDESLEEFRDLSYEAMRDRIRELENKNANLETELDTTQTREEDLKARLKKERTGSEYPDFVVVTRHESDALSQKALLCMDDMSRLMDDLIKLQNDEHMSSEFENHLNMSSTTLLIHLNGIQAKASQILHNAMLHLPPQLTSQQVNANMLYSDDEIRHSISEREMLVRDHEQEKQIRANEREANKPRGRGRPRKDA